MNYINILYKFFNIPHQSLFSYPQSPSLSVYETSQPVQQL